MTGNYPSTTALDRAVEMPYTSIHVFSGRTFDDQWPRTSRLIDEPRKIQHAREASQEDALESVRHFIAPEN